jgi:hypothetical protein
MRREKVISIIVKDLKKQGAKKIALFGSFARNQDQLHSDIDLLVTFKKKKSLLDIVRIERELSEKTGKKIDLLTEKSISPLILEHIQQEIEVVYG